jgi:hypothetical protein
MTTTALLNRLPNVRSGNAKSGSDANWKKSVRPRPAVRSVSVSAVKRKSAKRRKPSVNVSERRSSAARRRTVNAASRKRKTINAKRTPSATTRISASDLVAVLVVSNHARNSRRLYR